MDHPAAIDPECLLAECEIQFVRRSGPGGQNRNKVETGVVLTHRPSGLVAEASERRSQGENRAVALRRLRVNLALAVRHPVEPGAQPSRLWRSRCRAGRIAVNPEHPDFPALLAEALDQIAAHDADVRGAAGVFGCTASQLVKLLKGEPRALKTVNESRSDAGLARLK